MCAARAARFSLLVITSCFRCLASRRRIPISRKGQLRPKVASLVVGIIASKKAMI